MSEWNPRVVRLSEDIVSKHPNADKLSIANIDGFNVIFATEAFTVPSLAAYIPEDTVMPDGTQIKSKRLRGVLSIGMLQPLPSDCTLVEGDSVVDLFQITKVAEADVNLDKGDEDEACPFDFPKYSAPASYQRDAFRRNECLLDGKEIIVTEKIHGANARYVYRDGRLWVGSRNNVKRESESSIWWRAAKRENLEEKLKQIPNIVVYGEVYGNVQNLNYDTDLAFRAFDMYDMNKNEYLDSGEFRFICIDLGIEIVPILYIGRWKKEIADLANGQSAIASHHKEGIVIKPAIETLDDRFNRMVYKLIGEEYREKKSKSKRTMQEVNAENKMLKRLLYAHKALADHARNFVERVEKGEERSVRSVRTHRQLRTVLAEIDAIEQGK